MLAPVLDDIILRRTNVKHAHNRRLVIGLAGAVSVGKTTFAAAIKRGLENRFGGGVAIVGTDGFLRPNVVLAPRGRHFYKGFPDTYDTEALQLFLTMAATTATSLVIPTYSHEAFDTIGTQMVDLPEILLVEGINILGDPYASLLDFRVYLDADESVVIAWFVDRFLGLIIDAETDTSSFYARFVSLDSTERRATAAEVWDSINGPNLHTHIAPTKINADLVIRLRSDHSVEALTPG